MKFRPVVVVLLGLAFAGDLGGVTAQESQDTSRPRMPVVGRSVVATTFGIVAASQPLAARAGVQILERGGNAIDAAIAANATIGLMEPTATGSAAISSSSITRPSRARSTASTRADGHRAA